MFSWRQRVVRLDVLTLHVQAQPAGIGFSDKGETFPSGRVKQVACKIIINDVFLQKHIVNPGFEVTGTSGRNPGLNRTIIRCGRVFGRIDVVSQLISAAFKNNPAVVIIVFHREGISFVKIYGRGKILRKQCGAGGAL